MSPRPSNSIRSRVPLSAESLEDRVVPSFGDLLHTFTEPTPGFLDSFGESVAIDGNVAVVGAPSTNLGGILNAGLAYVYDVTTGALLRTLANPDPGQDDNFGFSVAVSGNLAVVGVPGDYTPGGTDAGSAYVFDVVTGALRHWLHHPDPGGFDEFGFAVAISGNRIVVGVENDHVPGSSVSGSVFVFDAKTGTQVCNFSNPTGESDTFGTILSVDGNRIVVGVPTADSPGMARTGAAYVFDADTGGVVRTLSNPEPTNFDYFGQSVAISAGRVVVGTPNDDPTGVLNSGSAYVFDVSTGAVT